ncbi:YoaK family protein [Aspergillus ruber CBS 135680]|uniref:DUF1275 domain protein n=1 Tax=Aspergillus ruber (strain CBS 135680) TaxID=1388766 RepID=A0A017SNC2_ASPRC|nr:uncharacterized protein EURHEDRAFT_448114 [Aspergillus ruber CBS 135680]EYE98452.1 hypothetical protein EURHEDRAFT_448114 [Aspergillus ruber CBS 135680]
MQTAYLGPEPDARRLTYDDDANNTRSKSRFESKDETTDGSFWSIRGGSTNASLSGRNQDAISPEFSLHESVSRYFLAEINTNWTDGLLIICAFVSGLVDGLSFNAWGSFSSMQSGNSVFIALGVTGQPVYPAYLWAKSLIALATYLIGNIIFIQVSRALQPLRRSTLVLSFSVQTAALLAAALLIQLDVVDNRPEDPRAPIQWIQVLPIALLAFQAAGQIVASRVLSYDEIPTIVLTTLLCDLLVDKNLCQRPWKANQKRNRRLAAFLSLFLGATTAGGLCKVDHMPAGLWLAMGLKLMITASFMVWKDHRKRADTGLTA